MRLNVDAAVFGYGARTKEVFKGLSIAANAGQLIVLTGKSGSGKSTLLRLIVGLERLQSGTIWVDGLDVAALTHAERIKSVGFVAQKPTDQILCQHVGHELAFAMESARFQQEEMMKAVPKLLAQTGLDVALNHPTNSLSGGEVQRLMTAACRAASAQLLLLDEPFAHLDRGSSMKLLDVLSSFCEAGGTALVVEHRLELLLKRADELWFLESGLIESFDPRAIQPKTAVFQKLLNSGLGLDRLEVFQHLDTEPLLNTKESKSLLWSAQDIQYRYPGTKQPQLNLSQLFIYDEETLFVLGQNGSGKSTLMGVLSGYLSWKGAPPDHAILVPQDPDLSLFCETVRAELSFSVKNTQVAELAEAFDLLELMDRAPQSLSKGERLRVAIAAAVSTEPKVLMLDEPTAGQDAFRVRALLRALRAYFSGTLLVVTHDVDLALSFGSRIVVLEGGMCAIEGAPSEVFQGLKSLGLTTRWSEFSVEQFGMVFDPLEAVDA